VRLPDHVQRQTIACNDRAYADARLTAPAPPPPPPLSQTLTVLAKMLPHNMVHWVKMYSPPIMRWSVAGVSVVFFLAHEDLPSILLETPYGVPTTWADVARAAGLMKSE